MRRRPVRLLLVPAVALAACTAVAATPHPGFTVSVTGKDIVVADVFDDTPAAALGIKPGDVVAKVNNRPATPDALRRTFSSKHVGSTMHLTFLRDGASRDVLVRLVDADKPATWAAAAAATAAEVEKQHRAAMDAFVAKHGPVRILDARIERPESDGAREDDGRRRVAVRIANASEHFLESCDVEVLFVDGGGRPVAIPGHENPVRIHGTREVPPVDAAGTRGIATIRCDLAAPPPGAAAMNVVVTRARLADGRTPTPEEPTTVAFPLAP